MKTFFNLIQEVQKPGLCHRCGGCVSFCTAINYGALELGEDGMPRFADPEKCIECGLCYMFCPVIGELEEESRKKALWEPPMGKVIETSVARARDTSVRELGTDGGVVTSILLRLFDEGRIDGAVVSRQTGLFQREPWLATTRKEIIQAAGSYFDASQGMVAFSKHYSTFAPAIQALGEQIRRGLRRVAVVGVPEQMKTIRKMQALGVVPTDSIYCLLGLFCSGNFEFGEPQRKRLEEMAGFKWEEVVKVNIKDEMRIHTTDGRMHTVPLEDLDFMKRRACLYCKDYAAEYADVSFGGLGADKGWTTVVTRTPLGRAIFADAKDSVLEIYPRQQNPTFATQALERIRELSKWKKDHAAAMIEAGGSGVTVAV